MTAQKIDFFVRTINMHFTLANWFELTESAGAIVTECPAIQHYLPNVAEPLSYRGAVAAAYVGRNLDAVRHLQLSEGAIVAIDTYGRPLAEDLIPGRSYRVHARFRRQFDETVVIRCDCTSTNAAIVFDKCGAEYEYCLDAPTIIFYPHMTENYWRNRAEMLDRQCDEEHERAEQYKELYEAASVNAMDRPQHVPPAAGYTEWLENRYMHRIYFDSDAENEWEEAEFTIVATPTRFVVRSHVLDIRNTIDSMLNEAGKYSTTFQEIVHAVEMENARLVEN